MAFIKITAIGNVGKDPIISQLPSGQPVANFSIASTEKWTDKQTQQKKERTTWLRCSVIGGLADVVAQYVFQGSKLYLEGTLRTDKYQKDGVEHESFEMRVTDMQMLGEPRGNGQANQGAGHQQGGRQQSAPPQGGYQQQPRQQQGGRQQPAPQQGGYQQRAPQQHGGYQQRVPQQQGGYQQHGSYENQPDFNDM